MRLVYVMDPLCGWCWGNSTGITALQAEFGERIPFDLLPGGMWAGPAARRQSPAVARFTREHDAQLARLTGARLGPAYLASLDLPERLLDSEPPSRAIVVARERWPGRLFRFARDVEAARFEEGLDLNEAATYDPICRRHGIDPAAFTAAWRSGEARDATRGAFAEAARYAAGYPTLILQLDDQAYLVAQGYTPPEALRQRVTRALDHAGGAPRPT